MRWRLVLFATMLLCCGIPALAQHRLPGSLDEFYSYGDNYYFEVVTLPGKTATKTRVLVNFRFTYDLLTFRRATGTLRSGNLYEAPASLYVEAIGNDGVINDRAIWQDTVRTQDYSMTNSKTTCLAGSIELALRPGAYTIKYVFDEETPGSGFSETAGPIKVDDFSGAWAAIGMPLFLRDVRGDTLFAATVDGNALYGKPIRLFVPLSDPHVSASLRYELWGTPDVKDAAPRLRHSGTVGAPGQYALGPCQHTADNLFFVRQRDDSLSGARAFGLVLTVPSDDLSPDDYLLLLSYGSGSDVVTDSVRFNLKWEDMPLSLTRPEYAIRSLYPIAVDDTIEALLSVGKQHQREALERFWAPRDPTPGTTFNEAMTEYYRRVDYAFFNFKTLEEIDGAQTDRGKIYILFGPPTDVTREMQPDEAPHEVWIYNNVVARKFIFVDEERNGQYRLKEYYDI